jgi:hypothetical protein
MVQNGYVHELEQKKLEYSKELEEKKLEYSKELEEWRLEYNKELEEKKKTLAAELEGEKVKLDLYKSEINRQLTLISRAFVAVTTYSASLRKLRDGEFNQGEIEEAELEIRDVGVEWDRTSEMFRVWQRLLHSGIYLKEKAHRRSTIAGWRELWLEVEDGKPLGLKFGEHQEKAILNLRNERDRILGAATS